MSQGYTVINGEKVEGRTLSFNDNGVYVENSNIINESQDFKDKKRINFSIVGSFVLGCVCGFSICNLLKRGENNV